MNRKLLPCFVKTKILKLLLTKRVYKSKTNTYLFTSLNKDEGNLSLNERGYYVIPF